MPHTYQTGNKFSATLKRTAHAVRTKNISRYHEVKATEKRFQDGKEVVVSVVRAPMAVPMTARDRHRLCQGR